MAFYYTAYPGFGTTDVVLAKSEKSLWAARSNSSDRDIRMVQRNLSVRESRVLGRVFGKVEYDVARISADLRERLRPPFFSHKPKLGISQCLWILIFLCRFAKMIPYKL